MQVSVPSPFLVFYPGAMEEGEDEEDDDDVDPQPAGMDDDDEEDDDDDMPDDMPDDDEDEDEDDDDLDDDLDDDDDDLGKSPIGKWYYSYSRVTIALLILVNELSKWGKII